MARSEQSAILLLIIYFFTHVNAEEDIFVANLNPRCMRCLCAASTGCPNEDLGCSAGYCGPFQISKGYWLDAFSKNPADYTDDTEYQACANTYKCASRIVKYYIARFAKDCNHDGVTTCEDFLMINYNGGYGCEKSMYRNPNSKLYLKRFINCTENSVV